MSDTYSLDDSAFDPADFIAREQRRVMAHAITSLGDDPDKVARAIALGDATGDHPALIYGDLENYESQHRAALTSGLLQSNVFLRQYVDRDPMNAKLSNDDYGNLDITSEKVMELMKPAPFGEYLKGAVKAYTEGVGTEPLGSSAFRTPEDVAFAQQHPLAGALAASAASLMELMSRPVKGLLATTAFVTGSREPSAMLEWALQRGDINLGHGTLPKPKPTQSVINIAGRDYPLNETAKAIEPWVAKGVEPPVGVAPAIDKIKVEQNAVDVAKLGEALDAATASATRERSPERFRDYIEQHGEMEIGIDAKAVAKLYEGTVPGDGGSGPLDFVRGIADKLAVAAATGGDVHISVADWLAHVDPEVAKGLEPDIRMRPGGVTATEAEALQPKLVVARQMPDGSVRVGKPGQIHADLIDADHFETHLAPPPTDSMGFATAEGKFLSREAAFEFVKENEPQRLAPQARAEHFQAEHYDSSAPKGSANLTQAIQDGIGVKPTAPQLSPFAQAMIDRGAKIPAVPEVGGTFAEAKESALTEPALQQLNAETQSRAAAAGRPAAKRGTIDALVQATFERLTLGEISSDKWLRDAAKAQRELATAKDPLDAYHASQRRELAVAFAKQALELEKAKASFDRVAKRYREREVSGASPEYTNAVHDILQRLGLPVKRSIQDVADSYGGLRDFVAEKEGDMRDLHVPEWLSDPNFRGEIGKLTAAEFAELHDAIKAITHNSRDELKVYKAGEVADLKVVMDDMLARIQSLGPAKPQPIHGRESQIAKRVRSWWWSGINVETMLNRLDRDNPSGPFYQYITHHFTEAANYRDRLVRDFQAKIAKIGHIEGMNTPVENTLFIDPLTGQPFEMSKRNVLGILQNVGNANNLNKLARGYGLTGAQVMEWLHARTTKADWDRAQAIGDIFGEIFDLANRMSSSISGVGIQRLPLAPFDTPHGAYPGWYNPIKYDPVRPGKSKRLMSLEEEGYYRATTPQGYAKDRTGYIAPVELNLDIVPVRMKQMLHDIAMRPAVIQLSKFFYNPNFEKAMTAHYGLHQAKEMIPFLKDIANATNSKSMTEQLGNQAIEFFRQNTIATLIGFNPGTVMKHGSTAWFNSMTEVGMKNYLREFKNITAETVSGRETWRQAMEKSEELQRRMRNYQELVAGHGSEINLSGARSKFMSLREMVMTAGSTPVSISDLLSAVPTWSAEYKAQLAKGASEGDAISLANRAVRRAHGSSVLSNKPSIARTNALGATFSSLYGFFSHMQQKQYELVWKAADTLRGQAPTPMAHVPDLMKGLMSYVVFPALIEELVTPMTNHDKKSWGAWAAESLLMGVSSSFIGVRDFVRAVVNVRDPGAGLIGTSMKAGSDVARDLRAGPRAFTPDKAGNLIKHTLTLGGVLSGLTNSEEGKMAEYVYRYSHGLEHPKGLGDFTKGLMFGKPRKH